MEKFENEKSNKKNSMRGICLFVCVYFDVFYAASGLSHSSADSLDTSLYVSW